MSSRARRTRGRIDCCPVCGDEIQATVPVHLEGIAFERDEQGLRLVAAHSTMAAFGGDAWQETEAQFYCRNDHDVLDELLGDGEDFQPVLPFLVRIVRKARNSALAGRGGRVG